MQDFLYIKHKDGFYQLLLSEILYFESYNKYTRVVCTTNKHLTLQTLSSIENWLPPDQFCRIHRSFIISLRHTKYFNATIARVGRTDIPIARQFKNSLLVRVVTLTNENNPFRKPGLRTG